MLTKPLGCPATRSLDDAVEIREGRRRRGVKQHAALFVARKDTVEYEQMEVGVQVQTAESLNREHRSALCIVDPGALRSGTVVRKDGFDEDARERGEHVGLERGKPAKLVWKREDVLPQGHVR